MKRLFFTLGIYVLLFPAVAILTAMIRGLILAPPGATWDAGGGLALVVMVGYMTLALPALATAIVHFSLDRLGTGFTPLLAAITAVIASETAFHTLERGSLAGVANLDFFAAIAGMTCCLVVDRLKVGDRAWSVPNAPAAKE
ncbi:MAG: hypothetical protein JOY90_24585 [Bradyrhizobium sp.]|uniref:hypothetical protein n=1 Tax=Bradyrhizobium sp. TaxID=376 RepID=UPI001D477924|nr:hypothetical protein [Bradyrhizobium sp.]MBV9563595.1 hypothetical protein [Bradyrhizobium sp.]